MASQPRDEYATKPLTAETWNDFAALVEANNGVWGGCWCIGFHPEGITNPPIDDLLEAAEGSKYGLVIYAAKRARQINAYYSLLSEGQLENVGPLVETHVQEKPLSIALREINDDLLTCEDIDPAELAAEEAAAKAAAADAGNA